MVRKTKVKSAAKVGKNLRKSLEVAKKRIEETKMSDEELMNIKRRYDVASVGELTPVLLIVIANSMANHKFSDKIDDTSKFKKYKKMVDKAICPKAENEESVIKTLMMGTVTAANDVRIILDNYKKEIDGLKQRQAERFANVWGNMPKLSTTLKRVGIKLAAIGLAGGLWNELYNLLKDRYFSQATSYILTTLSAAGAFLFMDRFFLTMMSYIMKGIDRVFVSIKAYLIERKYVRRKMDALQVFGRIFKEIIENSTNQELGDIDRRTIKKVCRNLPKI